MNLGEVQLEKLEIRGTPPSIIHQKHSDVKRGQTTYKREQGIFFFLLFNNILLFLKGEISWQDVICFVVQPKLTKMFLALGDVSYSSNLLQQPGNYKKSTNENPRQKGMTDVNRKNEGRQKNKHTVKKSYV